MLVLESLFVLSVCSGVAVRSSAEASLEGVGSGGDGCGELRVWLLLAGMLIRRGRLMNTDWAVCRLTKRSWRRCYARQRAPSWAVAGRVLTESSSVEPPGTSAASMLGSPSWLSPRLPEKTTPSRFTGSPSSSGSRWETRTRQQLRSSPDLSREPPAKASWRTVSCLVPGPSDSSDGHNVDGWGSVMREAERTSVEEVNWGRGSACPATTPTASASATAAPSAKVAGGLVSSPKIPPSSCPVRSGAPKGCPAATVRRTIKTL